MTKGEASQELERSARLFDTMERLAAYVGWRHLEGKFAAQAGKLRAMAGHLDWDTWR